MHKWTILATIIIIGTAVATGVWFFVKVSTENSLAPVTGEERRTFVSFFGEQFGFLTPQDDTPFAPSDNGAPPAPRTTFREDLARDLMAPLSDEMISGTTFVTTATTTATTTENGEEVDVTITHEYVRYVERETGHINDFSLESGSPRRVSNTTVPGIHEALFGPNGSFVVLRYLGDDNETIESYTAPLSTAWSIESTDLAGTFLPQNIDTIALNPNDNEIFYITTTPDQGIGRIADMLNQNQRASFVSPLREWLVSWEGDRIVLTTKPTYLSVGVASWLDTNGSLSRIVSGTGLTALPNPSGTRVLYATTNGTSLQTHILTLANQETFSPAITTLPEKCAWIDDDSLVCGIPNALPAELPDAWYQGRVSFTDTLWTINAANEQLNFLYAPEDTAANEPMDITNITVSDDGTIISLINKKDLRGWVADIANN